MLARKVWLVPPQRDNGIDEIDKMFTDNYLVSDIANPKKIVVNFGESTHTVLYDEEKFQLWKYIPDVLKSIFEADESDIVTAQALSNFDYRLLMEKESLVLHFDDSTPIGTFLNILEVKTKNRPSESWHDANEIYISLNEENYIVLSKGDIHLIVFLKNLDTENLISIVDSIKEKDEFIEYKFLGERLDLNSYILVPRTDRLSPPPIYMENIMRNMENQYVNNLVMRFMGKPVNYLRALIEEDGSRIYVDDPRTLKIYEYGKIAFYDPNQPETVERNFYLSIDTALKFIYDRIGFDRNLYLSDVEEIDFKKQQGYKFKFSLEAEGYPVKILDDEIKDYVEIDVFNTSVKRYVQIVRVAKEMTGRSKRAEVPLDVDKIIDLNKITMSNSLTAIQKQEFDNLNLDEKLNYIINNIIDINIVYIDDLNGDEHWGVSTAYEIIMPEGKLYYDIYSGRLIMERK